MADDKFHWLDVQRIAEELYDNHPDIAAYSVTFPELRRMIEALEGFEEQQGHPVNERILEEVQRLWQAEADELPADDEHDER
ncbi:MAG TPA: Fe-S cluster assembly protein IscX [Phycisphaerales bacterium]|nr:Fe-S cluster assembly protein IscX [Phycisphaerales bacterium]